MRISVKIRRFLDFALFVFPVLFLITFASFIPFLMNIRYSQMEWNGISTTMTYVGLEKFSKLFGDKEFWTEEVLFTIKYLVMYVIGANVVGLLAALWFVRPFRTANLMRGMFYVPHIISLVMIGYVWKFIFSVGMDSLRRVTGLSFFETRFLGSPDYAFLTLVFISVWYAAGYYAVIYIAGLKSISMDLLEAADIDGANDWNKFWYIKLPLIAPSITVCIFTSTLGGLKVFDLPLVLTNGGPAGATTSIAMSIYRDAYVNGDYGYATAKSLVFFVAIMIVTLLQLKVTKDREVEA